jgi:hypothetical protein
MTGTNCDLFTHKSSRSYLNHLVYIYEYNVTSIKGGGRAVSQLVEAPHHKKGGPGLDTRWGPWKFSSDRILLSVFCSPVVYSASNRYDYQEVFLGLKCGWRVGLTTLPSQLCRMSK